MRAYRQYVAASEEAQSNGTFEFHNQDSSANRRQRRRSAVRPGSSHGRPPITPVSSSGTTSRRRPFSTPSERYLQNERLNLADLREAGSRMNGLSSEIRALLDNSAAHIRNPDHYLEECSGEAEVNRRIKKRKLDHEQSSPRIPEISYGRFGQTEAGKLKMEIFGCDGGITSSIKNMQEQQYPPENALEDGPSVYCTKREVCNMILQHPGSIPFCVSKIIVRAPMSGFDMPIQEGLVFMAMKHENMISHAAPYRPRYTPPGQDPNEAFLSTYGNDPSQAAREPYTWMTTAEQNQNQRNAATAEPLEPPYEGTFLDDDFLMIPRPCVTVTSANLGSVQATTHNFQSRHRRLTREMEELPHNFDTDTEAEDEVFGTTQTLGDPSEPGWGSAASRSRRPGHPWRNDKPSRIEIVPNQPGNYPENHLFLPPKPPHAKFFMEKASDSCSISFNPPISSRYVLLRLFSPAPGKNIDLQNISVYGFAGPRFFSAAGPI
ncbi:MAG: hypothetical protein M1814_006124 [Vezdaea aestivalis]|nr:MAG: hypothetical protein M1814_006124 [Vezdaea aestivalis]